MLLLGGRAKYWEWVGECGRMAGSGWMEGGVRRERVRGRGVRWRRGGEEERCDEWVAGCGGWDVRSGSLGMAWSSGRCVG